MATPREPPPTILLAAIFSRHESAMDWATEQISRAWGKVVLASERFDHSETSYYESEMGPGLVKQFLVIDDWYDPARLADNKLESNTWEAELASASRLVVDGSPAGEDLPPRPVNIDPGYLTLTKLVLASAKDRAHRIYLRNGIYAEECLYYLDRRWNARQWTYPDYQRSDFQAFFVEARDYLKQKISTR